MSDAALIIEKRDGLLRELDALRNKVAGLNMAINIVAEEIAASGIETEGRNRETRSGAEHESPTAEGGDAHD